MAPRFQSMAQLRPLAKQPSPVDRFAQIAELTSNIQGDRQNQQIRQMQIQKAQREQQQAEAVGAAIMETGGDIEAALPKIAQVAPDLLPHYQDYVDKRKQTGINNAIATRRAQLENVAALETNPAPEMAVSAPVATPASYPGQIGQGPTTPGGTQAVPLPLPSQELSGIPQLGVGGVSISPESPQQKMQRMTAESRRKAAQELQDKIEFERAKQKAELEFNTTNPAQPQAPHVTTTAEGVMQWDPKTNTWHKIGERPPSQSNSTFLLNNPGGSADVVKHMADQIEDNPLNWNLVGGDKTLQKQVREELTARGRDVNRLTAATRQLGETADSIVPKIDATIKKLDNPKFQANLGPVMGRWNEFLTGKVGTNDPELAQLRATLNLMQTGVMRAHVGARGGETLLGKFESLIDGKKMDSETLKGSLTGVRDFLQGYRERIHPRGTSVESPDGTKRTRIKF